MAMALARAAARPVHLSEFFALDTLADGSAVVTSSTLAYLVSIGRIERVAPKWYRALPGASSPPGSSDHALDLVDAAGGTLGDAELARAGIRPPAIEYLEHRGLLERRGTKLVLAGEALAAREKVQAAVARMALAASKMGGDADAAASEPEGAERVNHGVRALDFARLAERPVRLKEFVSRDIPTSVIYALADSGQLRRVGRGVYSYQAAQPKDGQRQRRRRVLLRRKDCATTKALDLAEASGRPIDLKAFRAAGVSAAIVYYLAREGRLRRLSAGVFESVSKAEPTVVQPVSSSDEALTLIAAAAAPLMTSELAELGISANRVRGLVRAGRLTRLDDGRVQLTVPPLPKRASKVGKVLAMAHAAAQRGEPLRLADVVAAGFAAQTVQDLVDDGRLVRTGRGQVALPKPEAAAVAAQSAGRDLRGAVLANVREAALRRSLRARMLMPVGQDEGEGAP